MTDTAKPIRVLLADDHFFARRGLAAALSLEPDITVVAQASCGQHAIDLYAEHQPDVAILDGHMPDLHGTDVARHIVSKHAGAKLLLFSVEETEVAIHRAVRAGVNGYLGKGAKRSAVVEAVRTVAGGRRYFPEAIQAKLRAHRSRTELSTREGEVLRHIAHGLANKEIAVKMGISNETVKAHVAHLMHKLDVQDRTHALMVALERGILRLE